MFVLLFVYTIPLSSIVKYRLLDIPRSSWLSHIYPHEIPKWQYALSTGITAAEMRFLSDKRHFGESCSEHGIRSIPNLGYIPQGSDDIWRRVDRQRSLFLKPPNANRSQGCYILKFHDGLYEMKELVKTDIISGKEAIINELREANYKYSLIIQPYLQNTPIWQNLSQSTELITLRVITHLYQGAFTISAALIEIPIDDTSRYYDIIPVDPLSGSVQDQVFGPAGHKPNERQQSLLAKIADKKLPNWEKLHSVVEQAHALCPNVRTVGWDLAITSDGPIIIEGNLGWDTITLSKNPLSQSPTTYPI